MSKILIVEDEKIVALDIETSLKELGYKIAGKASSGEEAIKLADSTKPDIVLMDIYLQGEIDGIAAASAIHREHKIPVVYLTAYSDQDTLQRAKITEPFGYIIKPFKDRELHVVIETALYKHKMEAQLIETKSWLSTTLSSIGDAVISTDCEGFVKYMNPIAETLTEWSQEDAIGKPVREVFNIVSEETGKEVHDIVKRVVYEGLVMGMANHTVLITKSGQRLSIDNSCAPITDERGNILGVVLAFNEITKRKWLQDIVVKAREDYQTIIDSVPSMILYVNKSQKIIRANNIVANTVGMTVKEMVGKSIKDLFPKEASGFYKGNSEIIKTGTPKFGLITEYRISGGHSKWAQINKIPYMGKTGAIEGVILVADDITERKMAEDKLRSNEQNFRAIVENAYDGILILNDKGKVVFSNKRAFEIIGKREKEFEKKKFAEIMVPFNNNNGDQKKLSFENDFPLKYQSQIKGKKNKISYIDVTAVKTTWQDLNASLIFIKDITEQKMAEEVLRESYENLQIKAKKSKAGLVTAIEVINKEISKRVDTEKELRLSEEKFRAQYMSMPAPTFTWERIEQEFILVDYNDAAYEISHGEIKNMVGITAAEYFKDAPYIIDDLTTCYNDRTTIRREIDYKFSKESGIRHLSFKIAFVPSRFVLVHAEDVTEQKLAESALRESEARYRMLVKNQHEGIGIIDKNLSFVLYNPAAEKLLGLVEGELEGKNFSDFLDEDTFKYLKVKTDFKRRNENRQFEIEVMRADGAKRILTISSVPWLNKKDDIEGAFMVFRDETDKKRAEEEKQKYFQARLETEKKLYETNQLAEKSARLASIGVLAAGITHEINQPLNAVMMSVDHILYWEEQNKGTLPEYILNTVMDVSKGAKNIDNIIQHMRSFWVTPISDQITAVDLNEAIRNALLLVKRQILQHQIRSEIEFLEDSIVIQGNKVQLELIIINLVSNSIYSLDSKQGKDKCIRIKTYKESDCAYLVVEDNGIGLPAGVADELFDPFFSTKKPGEGMGLGLAIVKMFINRFKGKVKSFNNDLGGATFMISFPLTNSKREN